MRLTIVLVALLLAPCVLRAQADALVLAAQVGDLAEVERLLAAGADPDLPRCDGRTALGLALDGGRTAVAAVLRSAGADDGAAESATAP